MEQTKEDNTKTIYQDSFLTPIIRWGRAINIIACFLAFSPAIYLWLVFDALPPVSAIIQASIATTLGFSVVFWFVEPLSYFPLLGVPGTYMGFLSGNISNMRVPCSVMAQSAAGVEEGSMEGSIISVLGVGASILINLVVMIVGAFAGLKIISLLPPSVTSSLEYVLPAVFGGVFGQFAPKNIKVAIFALTLGCITLLSGILPVYVSIPLCIFLTIFVGVKLHNYEERKKN